MHRKISFTIITAAVLLFSSAAAYALPLSLTQVDGNLYNQTIQRPCVFSNNSCNNGGFASTDLPNGGGVDGYNENSPVYSGATIQGIIGSGNALWIGLDINQASGKPAQTVSGFEMLINGIVVDSFGPAMDVPAGNNGNGYADYLFKGFSDFLATDTVQFHFLFTNANDGPENLFLIAGSPTTITPTATPEPASLVLLGSGLLVAARQFRKKAKK